MPSFDVVSEVDLQEAENAINQTKKEIIGRYDFRGSRTEVSWDKKIITIETDDEYKLGQVKDILQTKMHRRGIDIQSLDFAPHEEAGGRLLRQKVTIKQGIDRETSKEICKSIKGSSLKVQAQIQEDAVRVTSKSKDELQACITHLRAQNFGLPLQFINFRA